MSAADGGCFKPQKIAIVDGWGYVAVPDVGADVQEREPARPVAAWWALVMGAAAALEDAAHCLSDPDAKRAAEGAAAHYRAAANALASNV